MLLVSWGHSPLTKFVFCHLALLKRSQEQNPDVNPGWARAAAQPNPAWLGKTWHVLRGTSLRAGIVTCAPGVSQQPQLGPAEREK